MSGYVYDSTFVYCFHPDSLARSLTFNGPGGLTDTVTVGPDPLNGGISYRKTFIYNTAGTKVATETAWVKV
jgi:hypothetical protein